MPSKIITDAQKDLIIKDYLSKPQTISEIAKRYNLSSPTIVKILGDTPRYKKSKVFSPLLKEDFFENIDTERKAYFLGLLISDGNVFKTPNKQHSISITLDKNDSYILEDFKESVGVTTKISSDNRGCCYVAVRSDKMAMDLSQYGVVPRKSLKTFLPSIKQEMMPHLLRGILDGDGSVRAMETIVRNRFAHYIAFCGTKRLMEDISDFCFDVLNLSVKPTLYVYKDKNLAETRIQNKEDMNIFGNFIYKDATIFLKRKKEVFDAFKSHYGLD